MAADRTSRWQSIQNHLNSGNDAVLYLQKVNSAEHSASWISFFHCYLLMYVHNMYILTYYNHNSDPVYIID